MRFLCATQSRGALNVQLNLIKNGEVEKEAGLLRLRSIASERGGDCLSSEYFAMNNYYDFKCAKGHSWSCSGRNFLLGVEQK